jgi:hypothetical protein
MGNIGGGYVLNNLFDTTGTAFEPFSVEGDIVVANNTVRYARYSEDPWDFLADGGTMHIRKNIYSYSSNGRGLNIYSTGDSVFVYNNIFYRKLNVFPSVGSTFGYADDQVRFFNNTIDGTTVNVPEAPSYGILFHPRGDTVMTIDNNIIINCDYGILNTLGDPAKVRYSCFFNVDEISDGPCELLEGNVLADPMFSDTFDFHLQAYSPCIDAGNPEMFDLDSSRSDIGCFGGQFGEVYDYQDLPPRIPDSLTAEVSPGNDTIFINWRYNTEADFSHYLLHRDTMAGFEPSVFNLVAEPETSLYIDTDFDFEHDYYYRIAALDMQDNMSDYSEELAVVLTDVDGNWDNNLPNVNKIAGNYPNPFNTQTKIDFYLADVGYQPALVQLYIYDVGGRLVRKLIEERRYPGEHSIVWDGKNDSGGTVSSGVYFVRLIVSDVELVKPRKLILLK